MGLVTANARTFPLAGASALLFALLLWFLVIFFLPLSIPFFHFCMIWKRKYFLNKSFCLLPIARKRIHHHKINQ